MPESLGGALSSLGNVAPSFLGGGSGGWMSSLGSSLSGMTPGASVPGGGGDYAGVSLPNNLGDVSANAPDASSSGGMMAGPVATGPYGPPPSISPPASASGSSVAGTAPFAGPPSPVAANWYTDPRNTGTGTPGGDPSVAFTDPTIQQSTTQKILQALFGGTGAGGKAAPGILGGLAAGGTDLLKYLQQRQLQDPNAIMAAAKHMNAANAKALRKQIFPQITATAQETGQINAPYLMNQAYTTAIAPILAQMQEQAINQWLEANRLTGGLYPGNQDISTLAGLVRPDIYGGSSGG